MKYPFYIEIRHSLIDGECGRVLVENEEDYRFVSLEIERFKQENPDIAVTVDFAGYETVVGKLETGVI